MELRYWLGGAASGGITGERATGCAGVVRTFRRSPQFVSSIFINDFGAHTPSIRRVHLFCLVTKKHPFLRCAESMR